MSKAVAPVVLLLIALLMLPRRTLDVAALAASRSARACAM
jgi:hypothetical protein